MKYGIVIPREDRARIIDCKTIDDAKLIAGLPKLQTDHGTCERTDTRMVGIVVYEFGLFEPTKHAHFSIGRNLYAGNAVLYGVSILNGETIDLNVLPDIRCYRSLDEIELAISLSEIERPTMAVNNNVVWRWPDPSPLPER